MAGGGAVRPAARVRMFCAAVALSSLSTGCDSREGVAGSPEEVGTVAAARDAPGAGDARRPNIIIILADDLGYADLGVYGQQHISTPRLDRMAAEGLRFTSCYAGGPVCAPSRCVLLTGKHTGHAQIRGNAGIRDNPLAAAELTIAEVLRAAGYATGAIGKWGLATPDTDGVPTRQGFDSFYGQLTHNEAKRQYPDDIWRNEALVELQDNARGRRCFSNDSFTQEALEFVRQNAGRPFFLYLAYTIPHFDETGGYSAPELLGYEDCPWTEDVKARAAQISRLDGDVGRLLDSLRELKIDQNTILFFTSDNGPRAADDFFQSAGPFRGAKSSLLEGNLRVPMIVRWPGEIEAARVSDYAWAHWDLLPTCAALAGVAPPAGIDGISIDAELYGLQPPLHAGLYWETHELQFEQAVRMGHWKGVRRGLHGAVRLVDLVADPGETTNVARENRDVVDALRVFLNDARVESPSWRVD